MVDEMKVLCIGESLLEITCPVNITIAEGQNLRLEEKIECGAGHAGNVAYMLGKWGVEAYIASMLGADDAANKILNHGVKLVSIAGPSASGKTTFSKKLGLQLQARGITPVVLSTDDYYKHREDSPKDDFWGIGKRRNGRNDEHDRP